MTQTTNREPVAFNPNDHLMQLKSREGSKDYLPVQWRLVWFRKECPQGTIDTEELEYDTEKECSTEAFVWNAEKKRSEKIVKIAKGYARYRAVVTDGKGGRATGTKAECRASFEDYGEKAETGAIGRALAGMGYGTAFAPELSEEDRIVDSPIEHTHSQQNGNTPRPAVAPSQGGLPGMATDNQVASIRNLCKLLEKEPPANVATMTYDEAKDAMGQLGVELRSRPVKK